MLRSQRQTNKQTMGEAVIRTIVEAIHSSPTQAVVYLSGGASVVSFSLYISLFTYAICK